ncbi:hypothetical protein [Rhizobium terrae]|uniref:hypothetical protein n=1 Tax=Rhizobium terrae TaxID=2171756 RepID=UPI000E3EB1EE|nr:hypothetical protein [Rhizobium terrae]
MPSTPVPVTAEGMTKFDRAAIMRKAWEKYREFRARYAPWQIERRIVDASFSNCLRISWRIAKREAAEKAAAAQALTSYSDRAADRVRELTVELMRIDAQPWGMRSHRTADTRSAIQEEIRTLQHELA